MQTKSKQVLYHIQASKLLELATYSISTLLVTLSPTRPEYRYQTKRLLCRQGNDDVPLATTFVFLRPPTCDDVLFRPLRPPSTDRPTDPNR